MTNAIYEVVMLTENFDWESTETIATTVDETLAKEIKAYMESNYVPFEKDNYVSFSIKQHHTDVYNTLEDFIKDWEGEF